MIFFGVGIVVGVGSSCLGLGLANVILILLCQI
jgi:hypothetical protein